MFSHSGFITRIKLYIKMYTFYKNEDVAMLTLTTFNLSFTFIRFDRCFRNLDSFSHRITSPFCHIDYILHVHVYGTLQLPYSTLCHDNITLIWFVHLTVRTFWKFILCAGVNLTWLPHKKNEFSLFLLMFSPNSLMPSNVWIKSSKKCYMSCLYGCRPIHINVRQFWHSIYVRLFILTSNYRISFFFFYKYSPLNYFVWFLL